jgi:iron complex outermembrane receptor protein
MKGYAFPLLLASLVAGGAAVAEEGAEEGAQPYVDLPPSVDGSESVAAVADLDLGDIHLEDILKVETVSATKTAQRASQAPSVVSAFLADQFKVYGWFSLNDILYKQPGFSPAQDFERPTISARGSFESYNNNHILLLVDGVPFNDSVFGTAYTWEVTPLFIANTVEVIRGPGSALYGSNAMNGVVSINTLATSGEPRAEATLGLGTHSSQRYELLATGGGTLYGAAAGFSHFRTDGNEYADVDSLKRRDPMTGELLRFQVPDSRESSYFFGKLSGRGSLDGLSLQLHHQDWSSETGHGLLSIIPGPADGRHDTRQLAALSWKKTAAWGLSQEHVLRYQRRLLDWKLDLAPPGATDAFFSYPDGIFQMIVSESHEVFARSQVAYAWNGGGRILGGAEYTGFFYDGDDASVANIVFGKGPVDGFRTTSGFLWRIRGQPVTTLGAYGQLVLDPFLTDMLSLTLGVRFDRRFFDHYVDSEMSAVEEESFHQLSPRAGLVLAPTRRLSLKLLAGKAFRAPTTTEFFVLGQGFQAPEPESSINIDMAIDYRPHDALNLRLNGYYNIKENEIGVYGLTHGNLYDRTIAGVELEALWGLDLGTLGDLEGFANVSYAQLVSEDALLEGLTSSDRLTWAAPFSANAGANYKIGRINAVVQTHVQGPIARRETDVENAENRGHRPYTVPSFTTVDAVLGVALSRWSRVHVQGKNLFDTRGIMPRTADAPFDFRIPPRELWATLVLEFH